MAVAAVSLGWHHRQSESCELPVPGMERPIQLRWSVTEAGCSRGSGCAAALREWVGGGGVGEGGGLVHVKL
jgi:hypothetical protein